MSAAQLSLLRPQLSLSSSDAAALHTSALLAHQTGGYSFSQAAHVRERIFRRRRRRDDTGADQCISQLTLALFFSPCLSLQVHAMEFSEASRRRVPSTDPVISLCLIGGWTGGGGGLRCCIHACMLHDYSERNGNKWIRRRNRLLLTDYYYNNYIIYIRSSY